MVRLPRRSVGERLRRGRSIGDVFEEELSFARVGPLKEGTFPSRLHSERIARSSAWRSGSRSSRAFSPG